jgi:hypothetical protein
LVFLSIEVSAYEKSLEDLKGELKMAMDLVRSLEQQRLPPREVREAIRGFTADIEGGNDFIREKWHNNANPPIMNPGWDLTFGTQDEGPGNQFEDPGNLKSSKKSIIPSTDPGITEPEARKGTQHIST